MTTLAAAMSTAELEKELVAAAGQGNATRCVLLLNSGVKPNCINGLRQITPMYKAAECGFIAVVQALLEHGGDPSIGDRVSTHSQGINEYSSFALRGIAKRVPC